MQSSANAHAICWLAKQGPIADAGRKKLPNFCIIGLLTLRSNRHYPSLAQLAKSVPYEVAPMSQKTFYIGSRDWRVGCHSTTVRRVHMRAIHYAARKLGLFMKLRARIGSETGETVVTEEHKDMVPCFPHVRLRFSYGIWFDRSVSLPMILVHVDVGRTMW
ncbi:hypothetical protein A0H81_12020 [Grifola frondosa]|uniref:Uncharacterized protein n=1 Tax=Grifola frondosa TaxID=5627 RepID=A0A1C7LVV3_GRIFR|nr:hypothetical protein A0H81_12020 [Grifola frondosa]